MFPLSRNYHQEETYKNFVRMPDRRNLIYKFVKDEVAKGRQAYIVCPLIEESENSDAVSVEMIYDELTSGYLYGLNCALLHGKLKPKKKKIYYMGFLVRKNRCISVNYSN